MQTVVSLYFVNNLRAAHGMCHLLETEVSWRTIDVDRGALFAAELNES